MTRWVALAATILSAIVLGSCGVFTSPTKVVFTSNRTGFYHVYIMSIAGTEQTQLTFGSVDDLDPAISPRGDRIAFVANRGVTGNLELYTMNVDGSTLIQRTSDSGDETDPSWSPNGRYIAFCFAVGGGDRSIYVYDTLNSTFTLVASVGDNQNPSFHPDGQHIVFGSDRNGSYDIYRANWIIGEPSVFRLTFDPEDAGDPSYSPGGGRICFVMYRAGLPQVFTMAATGTDIVQLTSNLSENFDPHYTPDGNSIVWTVFTFGVGEIFRMRTDGTDVVNLTQNAASDERPTAARVN
jgi:TolB protein